MTDGLERIDEAFEEFRSLVEHCRNEAKSDMADIRDAYERFYRLRERYEHEDEARTLSQTEEAALRKVFREDKFIESVGRVRGVSAHVETGDERWALRSRLNHRLPPCLRNAART
jgi:hypothetical protein